MNLPFCFEKFYKLMSQIVFSLLLFSKDKITCSIVLVLGIKTFYLLNKAIQFLMKNIECSQMGKTLSIFW